MQSYQGACHCGRVTFEVRAELNYVVDCNCSVCRRKGALWHPAAEADLRIVSGEADLALYQFNTKTAARNVAGLHAQAGLGTLLTR